MVTKAVLADLLGRELNRNGILHYISIGLNWPNHAFKTLRLFGYYTFVFITKIMKFADKIYNPLPKNGLAFFWYIASLGLAHFIK